MQGKPPGSGVSSGIVGVGSGPGVCSSGSHKGGKRAKGGGGSAGVVVGHYSQEPSKCHFILCFCLCLSSYFLVKIAVTMQTTSALV